MKKNFKWYALAWALVLGLFNLCVFLVKLPWIEEKYTAAFWIGYSITIVAFIGQLVLAWISVKDNNKKKIFYNISLLSVSYTGLVTIIITSLIFMLAIPVVGGWLAAIVCAVVLVVNIIAVIMAKASIDMVTAIDKKIEKATAYVYGMREDSESLVLRAKTEEIQKACKSVRDAFKYSDPMSSAELAAIEGEITVHFGAFKSAVLESDAEKTTAEGNELLILIKERNNKCKNLK